MKALIALTLVAFVAAQAPIQVQVPQGPGVQVQFPGNNQPQWQMPQQPQPPTRPNQPQPPTRPNPRQTWRDPVADSRCPPLGQDDHDGDALIFNDPTNANGFRMCWGGWAWPFSCPAGTTWWNARTTCAFQSQIDAARQAPNWNLPNFRPFDSENAEE